jgi:hypothetical protein
MLTIHAIFALGRHTRARKIILTLQRGFKPVARKKVKMLDPQWIVEHRKDRHRLKTAVKVRLTDDEKVRWQDRASQRGMMLTEWVIAACRAFEREA